VPKTINSYSPDRFEIEIEITAADVTAIAAFTTAESIILDGAARKFEESQPKTREYNETYVAGDDAPVVNMSGHETATTWQFTILDDYFSGLAGEWGTDNLSVYEIFDEFFQAKRGITSLKFTPAGGSTGSIQTTLSTVEILTLPHPKGDADNSKPNELPVTLIVQDYTKAAHA
jgi:hypothetical protein